MALFLARERVLMTLPDGNTTVALTMYSPFMLPKRTAAVPEPPHPITVERLLVKSKVFDGLRTYCLQKPHLALDYNEGQY